MRFILLTLVAGLLLLGCITPPQTPSPAPTAVITPVAATPLATVSVTVKPTTTAKPSVLPSVPPAVSVTPLPSATPAPTLMPSPTPVVTSMPDLKALADKLYAVSQAHFGKSSSMRVYSTGYDAYAITDATSRYKLDVSVTKAKFKWGEYDYLTNFTSPSNKTIPGTLIYNPTSSYYGYDFRFLCFNDKVDINVQTREYSLDPAATPELGKTFAPLVVDVCG